MHVRGAMIRERSLSKSTVAEINMQIFANNDDGSGSEATTYNIHKYTHNTCPELHCAVVSTVIVDDEKKYVIYTYFSCKHIYSRLRLCEVTAEKKHWFSCICLNASMCVLYRGLNERMNERRCMDSLDEEKKLTLLNRVEFALKLWNLYICINNIINFGWLILPHSRNFCSTLPRSHTHMWLGDFPKKSVEFVLMSYFIGVFLAARLAVW